VTEFLFKFVCPACENVARLVITPHPGVGEEFLQRALEAGRLEYHLECLCGTCGTPMIRAPVQPEDLHLFDQ